MELKKVCGKALSVITGAVVVPLGLWYYSMNTSSFSKLARVSASFIVGEKIKSDNLSLSSATDSFSELQDGKNLSKRGVWDIDMAREETETPSVSKEIPSPQPSEQVLDAIPYPTKMNNKDGVIEYYNYGYYTDSQYFDLDNGGQVRNCTSISNEELYKESKKDIDFSIDAESDKPQILIYHTHTTESFEPSEKNYYDSSFSCKTTDRTKNIVAVGDSICKELDKAGIAYVHDTLVHDYPSYDGSYDSSRKTVQEILKKYPSIKICLDIHRDGIEREDGTRLAPYTEINGKKSAQIMIISCCDDGTMNMPDYLKNFQFASKLQSQIESDWNGLTRPVLFDYRFYNQDLTTGSLLIEVGSQANSIEQVKYSGELIGKSLAEMFS